MAKASSPKRRARPVDRESKLQAILDAALTVFSEKGYAEARLDEVAERAGVAKGTIYLYVSSKQSLFEELIRSAIGGPIGGLEASFAAADRPAAEQLRLLLAFITREILGTSRREVLRLVLTEAGRFPEVAELYHREVLSVGLRILRGIATKGVARGEFTSDELVRFPQLVIAPALVGLLWKHLFDRIEPLDTAAMLDAHLGLLLRALSREPT
jgi:AcrR family transcriptional regulator